MVAMNSVANAVKAPDRYIPPRGITGYISTGDKRKIKIYDQPNFARLGPDSQVHTRTVTESAAVADLVNQILGGKGYHNPGLDCGDDRAILDDVWACTTRNQNGQISDPDCFKRCKIVGQ